MSRVPSYACRWDTGTILFDCVHATPDLSPTSILSRQAAELGISHEAALRNILANSARRAGLAEIPPPIPQSLNDSVFLKLPPPRVRLLIRRAPCLTRCTGCTHHIEGSAGTPKCEAGRGSVLYCCCCTMLITECPYPKPQHAQLRAWCTQSELALLRPAGRERPVQSHSVLLTGLGSAIQCA